MNLLKIGHGSLGTVLVFLGALLHTNHFSHSVSRNMHGVGALRCVSVLGGRGEGMEWEG